MRDIKFRAWDKQNKNFHTWGALKHLPLWEYVDNQNYELMQYTGLKDKNGAEIYEGDVIDHYRRDKEEHFIQEVVWGDKTAQFILKNNKSRSDVMATVIGKGWADMEVVGNIYEDEGLLNKETK